jgi:cation diffusion facilitator family transporter
VSDSALSLPAPAFDARLRGPIILSILAALLTIVLKGAAYLLTGSVGLFADALESLINLMAGVTAYLSLWYASRPADRNHTFGHEKIEFFSSGLEGVLVCIAGLGTAFYAVKHIIYPEPLQSLELGAVIALIASGINLVVAWQLLRVGKAMNSLVLQANGQHLLTDVYTSVGVVGGLALVWLTNIKLLDPILAGLIGLHIVWTGLSLVRASFNGLMDHALSEEEQQQLRVAIQAALPPGTTFHYLRTRLAGRRKFVDFHLLVDGNLAVRAAHTISHDVEAHLRQLFPELEVTMHLEPIDEEASWEPAALASLGEPSEPMPAPIAPPPIDD